MKEDIIGLFLQTEKEYHEAIKKADERAEQYKEDIRSRQATYLDGLKHDWLLFEKNEREKIDMAVSEYWKKMEITVNSAKEQLKKLQTDKIEQISERLKGEILHGDS